MQHRGQWKPSKFVYKGATLVASRDVGEVAIGSRLMADIVAAHYALYIKRYVRGVLLDLGCGKVPLYEAYRDFVIDNICVDWIQSPHGNEYLDVNCDLAQDLPFADATFDTVILSDVLEHIPEPMHLLREISRLLSKNGTLIMNVPFFYWLHEEPNDYYRYTEFALRRLVETAGLQLIELRITGGVPEIIADLIAKNVAHLRIIGPTLAACAQALTAAFLNTSAGQTASRKTCKRFPLGYFVIAERR